MKTETSMKTFKPTLRIRLFAGILRVSDRPHEDGTNAGGADSNRGTFCFYDLRPKSGLTCTEVGRERRKFPRRGFSGLAAAGNEVLFGRRRPGYLPGCAGGIGLSIYRLAEHRSPQRLREGSQRLQGSVARGIRPALGGEDRGLPEL